MLVGPDHAFELTPLTAQTVRWLYYFVDPEDLDAGQHRSNLHFDRHYEVHAPEVVSES